MVTWSMLELLESGLLRIHSIEFRKLSLFDINRKLAKG